MIVGLGLLLVSAVFQWSRPFATASRSADCWCKVRRICSSTSRSLSRPGAPPTVSLVGPTFAVEELAGRNVVARFDRAAARDFVDVYMLARRFPKDTLLALALEVDAGFDPDVHAEMLAHIGRTLFLVDVGLPLRQVKASGCEVELARNRFTGRRPSCPTLMPS